MANIKQIQIGETIYDIAATSFDGVLPIENGGTDANSPVSARINLGFEYGEEVPTHVPATGNGSVYFLTQIDNTPLSIKEGGTGANSAAGALTNLGLTATATELNYVDGVTSNIQTQLNGKAESSHNHNASNITSGTLSSDRLPTVPVSKGGTGATTLAAARKTLNNVGMNPIASTADDTPANWVALNNGVAYFNKTVLNNQPAQRCFVVNKVQDSTVHQELYIRGTNLKTYTRSGDTGAGWHSAWKPAVPSGNARGTAGATALAATVMTTVPLDHLVTNTAGFTISKGGIKCPYAGIVEILGSVYMDGGVSGGTSGAYIFKGNTEVTGMLAYTMSGGTVSTTIEVAANDVIYLKARSMVACNMHPNSGATELSIKYIG